MQRRKPLKRGGPLKRSPLKRSKRLKPVSERRASQADARRAVVSEVIARDGGCVASRLGMPGKCMGPLTAHEVVKRSQLRDAHLMAANCVAVCWFHNGQIEDEPALARKLGLVRSRWEYDRERAAEDREAPGRGASE